jgi:CubicO group peptidase (beta-lactamase class C family)
MNEARVWWFFRFSEWLFTGLCLLSLALPVRGWYIRASLPCNRKPEPVLRAECENFCRERQVPGMAVALIQGDKVFATYLGVRDLARPVPVDSVTIFELGGSSLPLTCALFQVFSHFGAITWDHSLDQVFPPHMRPITNDGTRFRNLASQTSGFPSLPEPIRDTIRWEFCNPYQSVPEQVYLDCIRNPEGKKAPDNRIYTPSIFGEGLLGDGLEIYFGKPLNLQFQEFLAFPLDMPRTRLDIFDSAFLAQGYTREGHPACYSGYERFYAGQGFRSSLPEMTRFLRAHLDSRHEGFRLFRKLWEPVHRGIGFGTGLGWLRDELNPELLGLGPAVFNQGLTRGFSSFIGFLPQKNTGIVVLANSADPAIQHFAYNLLLLGGQHRLSECHPDFVPPAQYRRFPPKLYNGREDKTDSLLIRLKMLNW